MLLLCLLWPCHSHGAIYRIPLKEFISTDMVKLTGDSDSTEDREDRIPISPRFNVDRALLRFDYVCSSALLLDTSWLCVMINDYPVSQITLDPRAPEGHAEVSIDKARLKPGYNRLVFFVTQHVTRAECEDPSLGELWTRIDLTTAELELEGTYGVIPQRLDAIGTFLFDPRDLMTDTVHMVVPEITPSYLKRAGLAAAGAAIRRKYRPMKITLSNRLRYNMDNIVIGPIDFLKEIGASVTGEKKGALMGISPMPLPREEAIEKDTKDPSHALVYLSGETEEALDLSAKAFSLLSTPFPPDAKTVVSQVKEPETTPYQFQGGVSDGGDYSLSSLGYTTMTFQGSHSKPHRISFRLPSDIHIEPNQAMLASMNLSYGSGMRSDSALNLEVNGKFMAAIPLNNPMGGAYHGYKVEILGSALRPGMNTIRFTPVLSAPVQTKCMPIQEGNLVVTLSDDSFIRFPKGDHWTQMPRLEAFMIDAFPFGRFCDLRETIVRLPGDTFTEAASALNVIALAAQKIGYPPTGLRWKIGSDGGGKGDKDMILIGSRKALQNEPFNTWLETAIPVGERGWVPQPQLERPSGRAAEEKRWRQSIHKWLGLAVIPLPMEPTIVIADELLEIGSLAEWGYIAESSLMKEEQRTLLTLVAENEEELLKTAHALWNPEVQARIRGGLVGIHHEASKPLVQVLNNRENYYIGAIGSIPFVTNLINTHPILAFILLLSLLLCSSLLFFVILRRYKRRRSPNE